MFVYQIRLSLVIIIKPWVSKHIQSIKKKKKMTFKSGNTEKIELVYKELKREIRRGTPVYKIKLENQFKEMNA